MSIRAKQRPQQHVIDSTAQDLLRASLPKHWVLREYRPDYGIDFDLEIFKGITKEESREAEHRCETLGEHVFIQLKGCSKAELQKHVVYQRVNVEKTPLQEDKSDPVGEMEVIAFSLDVSELVTVQRMGSALPVLLVVADLASKECYFVCLNDYIEKVLLPKCGNDYCEARQRTVYVPTRNRVGDAEVGLTALRWYAKRAKLFAAFQKFVYQYAELQYAFGKPECATLAKHIASVLLRYDFWDDTEMWAPIPIYGAAIRHFLEKGAPGMMRVHKEGLRAAFMHTRMSERALLAPFKRLEVLDLWRVLALLPRNYEEVCREWFLPTFLGALSS